MKALANAMAKTRGKTIAFRHMTHELPADVSAYVDAACAKDKDPDCKFNKFDKVITKLLSEFEALEKRSPGNEGSAVLASIIETLERMQATIMSPSKRAKIFNSVRRGGNPFDPEFLEELNTALGSKPGSKGSKGSKEVKRESIRVGRLDSSALQGLGGGSSGNLDEVKKKFKMFYKMQKGNTGILHSRLQMLGVHSESDRNAIISDLEGDDVVDTVKEKLVDFRDLSQSVREFFADNNLSSSLADDLIDSVIMTRVEDMMAGGRTR